MCESIGGHIVEVHTMTELKYLTSISRQFWLGLKRDLESGLWLWERSGERANLAMWSVYDYGKEAETRAVSRRDTPMFAPAVPRPIGTDVICETPSKFVAENPPALPDPFPEPLGYESKMENDVTYYLSRFSLPWAPAQEFCKKKGGWLAEIETSLENQELIKFMLFFKRGWAWIGGRASEDGWVWSHTNATLEESFTDWRPDQSTLEIDKSPRCILLNDR